MPLARTRRITAPPWLAALWFMVILSAVLAPWPSPAKAGMARQMHPLNQIDFNIESSDRLTYEQKANWRAILLPAARHGLRGGLHPEMVMDLAQVALNRGAEPWTYYQIIKQLVRARARGRDPVRLARRLVKHYYHSPAGGHYPPPARPRPWLGPGSERPVWIQAADFRANLVSWRGTPFVPGARGMWGVDMTGFTRAVFGRYGLHLPLDRRGQAMSGTPVSDWNLRLGDLVVLSLPGRGVVHLGIYMHNGLFMHADPARGEVAVSSLGSRRFAAMHVQGRRLVALADGDGRQAMLSR